MDFYVIPPLSYLDLMDHGDRYFCLAHLYVKDSDYREFFERVKEILPDAWITLDNGAAEGSLVTEDDLIEVVRTLQPNEVIPPDILFDADATFKAAKSFHKRMKKEGLLENTEIFFCPQGETQQQWLECYEFGLKQDWISTIGLSKIAVPKAFLGKTNDEAIMEARHACFAYLKANGLLQKPLHLLGMGDPREFVYYQLFEEGRQFVRSSDSCYSVWSAMNGLDWGEKQYGRVETPHDYFDRDIALQQVWMAQSNIDVLRQMTHQFSDPI